MLWAIRTGICRARYCLVASETAMSAPVEALRRMLKLIESGEVKPDLIYIAVQETTPYGVDYHADYGAKGREPTAEELSDLMEGHLKEMFDNGD